MAGLSPIIQSLSTSEASAGHALEGLVGQFSSALDCYRELVQNSIDAGTNRVDVWLEFIPPSTVAIHVDDYGEGMDEAIIDHELTRLFSSSKENDLTKIGKFGVGFVSIFALEPKAVLLHTGRGGQYWELLFHEDRTFTKTALDTPTEGTQVTLFLEGDRHRYTQLVCDSRATLKRWCAHSDTEVSFEDRSEPDQVGPELINVPLSVEGECVTRIQTPGTEIVMAYRDAPSYGFYNKGLTLLATVDTREAVGDRAERFGHIAFCIKSRYLEHTLSRETILRDAHYAKALDRLERAAGGALCETLLSELETLAIKERLDVEQRQRYACLMTFLSREPASTLAGIGERAILRQVAGGAISPEVMRQRANAGEWLYLSPRRSDATDTLAKEGTPVVWGRPPIFTRPPTQKADPPADRIEPVRTTLLRYLVAADRSTILGRVAERFGVDLRADVLAPRTWLSYDPHARYAARIVDPHEVLVAVEIETSPRDSVVELINAAKELLDRIEAGYTQLVPGILSSMPARLPLFLVGPSIEPLMIIPPPGRQKKTAPEQVAVVNQDHRHFRFLLDISRQQPRFAAYALAKALLLNEDRLLERDLDLVAALLGPPPEED